MYPKNIMFNFEAKIAGYSRYSHCCATLFSNSRFEICRMEKISNGGIERLAPFSQAKVYVEISE